MWAQQMARINRTMEQNREPRKIHGFYESWMFDRSGGTNPWKNDCSVTSVRNLGSPNLHCK